MTATAAEATTLDAFHRGAFWLVQPAGRGHRAGTDAMILAAAVPSGFSDTLADLGAGAGAAGLAVLARCGQAKSLLVERSPDMLACAEASLQLVQNREIASRAQVLALDVTAPGRERAAAGLADRSVDFAIMNPPFNAARDRATPDALRREAHVMEEAGLERWLRTAAAIVRPHGGLAVIARPAQLGPLLAGMEGRFGGPQVKGIHARPDEAAIRIVIRAWRGSRAGLSVLPPLFIHERAGHAFSAEADAINNGRTSLFRD